MKNKACMKILSRRENPKTKQKDKRDVHF